MGRGKRTARATAGRASALGATGPVAQGQRIFKQDFADTPVAGYDLKETWAMKARVEPPMARLLERIRAAFPHLGDRLPVIADEGGHCHFPNQKARWFYHNLPTELRWEHESASEYVLSPEHDCFVHAIEKGGVNRVWYRYPDGSQVYYEGERQLLEIHPSGDVVTADGWLRYRTRDGLPKPGPDGATDVHRDGTREWRAAVFKKPERLPHDLWPLHNVDGPAVVHADGRQEHWRRGRQTT